VGISTPTTQAQVSATGIGKGIGTAVASAPTPNSVVHQYTASNFTPTSWEDNIGQATMAINGPTKSSINSEPFVSTDGVDDFGITSTTSPSDPSDLPGLSNSFSFAMTFNDSSKANNTSFFSVNDNGTVFEIADSSFRDSSLGELLFTLIDDNGNTISVETSNVFIDGQTHLLVLQKANNTASGITVYVDDMTNPVSTVTHVNQNFDHTNYSVGLDMGFFARSTNAGIDRFNEMQSSFFEFNTDTYSSTQLKELKRRVKAI
jgi:hypothetical protein